MNITETRVEVTDAQLSAELRAALAAFERARGRGIELADEIDSLRAELRSRAARKGWRTRKCKPRVRP